MIINFPFFGNMIVTDEKYNLGASFLYIILAAVQHGRTAVNNNDTPIVSIFHSLWKELTLFIVVIQRSLDRNAASLLIDDIWLAQMKNTTLGHLFHRYHSCRKIHIILHPGIAVSALSREIWLVQMNSTKRGPLFLYISFLQICRSPASGIITYFVRTALQSQLSLGEYDWYRWGIQLATNERERASGGRFK